MAVTLDPNFKAIPLSTAVKSPAVIANAASQGITPEQYVQSRGGINASGYYGDSYGINSADKVSLTDAEYNAAKKSATGGAPGATGAAINAALANKIKEQTGSLPDWSASSDKVAADNKIAADKAAADKVAADKVAADKAAADKVAADKAAEEAAALKISNQNRQSIVTILTDRFNKYGLGSLAAKIRDLAIDGASEATITIGLQETEEYKVRFSANTDRINKGLKVLTPGEYLNLEDGYRQILRSYGLKQFDTDAYVKQFISNDVSAAELSDRVVTAVQRVQNADPAISKTLRDYYGIGSADMVAYVLDPNQQLQKIQRQVAAAEVGTAARRQGLEAGVQVSEQLAAQGVSEAEAQKGYATIANILPTAEKLSQIYGGTMQKYGQAEGEQEVFNSLASAQRAREKLSAREIAQFQGSSGANKTSLTSQNKGQI